MKSIHRDEYLRFLERLKLHRKARDISQAQVALRLKRQQPYVSKIESGERRMDVLEFVEWSQAIELDPFEAILQLCDDLHSTKLRRRR